VIHIPKDDALIDEDRDKIVITTDTYTNRLINQILKSGEFNSVSALIRAAVQFFAYHRLTLGRSASYASLHPHDRKVQQEIDAQLAQIMPLLEEGDTVLVDRGTGEVRIERGRRK